MRRILSLSLGEQVIAALLAGAALLLAEVRFEHREVLGETWHAWLPLGFGLALALGAVGVWFHAGGHPVRALGQVAGAWLLPPGHDGGVEVGSAPPVLAPGAFAGIGLLGLLACLRR